MPKNSYAGNKLATVSSAVLRQEEGCCQKLITEFLNKQ